MTDRTKKILFAVGFSILSIGIGYGLFFFFFVPLTSPPPSTVVEQPGEALGGNLPIAPAGQPTQPTTPSAPGTLQPSPGGIFPATPEATGPAPVILLRDAVTQAVTPTSDQQGARFYSPDDGRFYRVNPDGSIATLGDKQFFNVDSVDWSPKSNEAIINFPDGTNVFYNFDAKRQTTLPKHWESFDFSPDGDKVVGKSMALDASSRFLFVSNPDGNEAKAIEPLGDNANRVITSWSPNHQIIGFSQTGTPQPDGASEILLIGQNHENFKSLIVPGRGFQPNWSPSGNQLLYSVYHERDQLKPSLWITGGSGDNIGADRKSLNLQTWASKCAWKDDTQLICGVPQSLDPGAGLAPNQFSTVPDDVYRVDLRTGVSLKINTSEQNHPILHPIVSKDGSKLIFSDGATGRMYEYHLQ